MKRILFDSLRASKSTFRFAVAVGVGLSALVACGPKAQPVAVEIGGGMRKGSPPMCFQYRSEATPTMRAYNIFLHLNNTCSYVVDCVFHDDVTDRDHHIAQPPFQAQSFILAAEVTAKRVDLDVECTWKP